MVASAVYIVDERGKVLIHRNYRGDIDPQAIDLFIPWLNDREEDGQLAPVLQYGDSDLHFVYVKVNGLFFVALCTRNAKVALVLTFLHRAIRVFEEYFEAFDEEAIRDNFVLIYELLDEFCDYGYPQTTEAKILQQYVTTESHGATVHEVRPPAAVTNAVSWRSEGLRYKKNEVFLDVIESINMMISSTGVVVRSEVLGSLQMHVRLTGMPELRLGLNDKVLFEQSGRRGPNKGVDLEDVKFHQCVRLSRFENDRTISFIPPDGDFELMSYRLEPAIRPLLHVDTIVEYHKHSRVEYLVKVRAQFKRRSTANCIEIQIPCPCDADKPKFRCTVGNCRYEPEHSAFIWSIKTLNGGKDQCCRAHFGLPTVESAESARWNEQKPPVLVRFEIPYFTVSGIQVRYLKIMEKSNYEALPWVRYITQNGDYQIRF